MAVAKKNKLYLNLNDNEAPLTACSDETIEGKMKNQITYTNQIGQIKLLSNGPTTILASIPDILEE